MGDHEGRVSVQRECTPVNWVPVEVGPFLMNHEPFWGEIECGEGGIIYDDYSKVKVDRNGLVAWDAYGKNNHRAGQIAYNKYGQIFHGDPCTTFLMNTRDLKTLLNRAEQMAEDEASKDAIDKNRQK